MKAISIEVPNDTHFKLKHKCRYYDYTIQQVLTILISNFNEGKYDEDFVFPKED